MKFQTLAIAAALVAAASGASAQQAQRVTQPVEPSATVSLTVRGPEAKPFLTVKATNAEARGLLKDMARKADATLYLSPSVAGAFTGTFESLPPEAAITSVVSSIGCKLMRISVPKDAPALTAEAAGKVYDAFTVLPQAAVARDVASTKSVIVSAGDVKDGADAQVIYYVQGKLTPDQERAGQEARAIDRTAKAATSTTGAVQSAVAAFQKMPVADRMQAMRDMQRQMFQNMTPQEQNQLRDSMRQQRGQRFQRN